MTYEMEMRVQICEIGKRLYGRNMAAANNGNISIKLSEKEWLCTPTGISKGFMDPECICKVNAQGSMLQASGIYRPSSEIQMHMRVYEKRPDVSAVVHAHPVYATSFAIAGIPLTAPIMPESVIFLGCVPIAEYGTPSTMEMPNNIEKYLEHYDAILLESHGALSWGQNLVQAYHTMEALEMYAELLYHSRMLGGPKELSRAQVTRLYDLRKKLGIPGRHPADLCLNKSGDNCHNCAHAVGGDGAD